MPAPISYTEPQLMVYMLNSVGNLAYVLDLNVEHFSEAVTDTLLAYGDVNTLVDATDIKKLRALARVEAWKVAVAQAAGKYDFASHDGDYKRSMIHQQAINGLAIAQQEAAPFATLITYSDYVVGISSFRHVDDPYALPLDDDAEQ